MAVVEVHGKNGLIYISGSELEGANTWSLRIATASAEVPKFGDAWTDREVGLNDWSGSLDSWHDQESKQLQDAAVAGVSVALLIYPKRSDLTTFYSGNAIFETDGSASMTAAVAQSASFVADGDLTMTGFS